MNWRLLILVFLSLSLCGSKIALADGHHEHTHASSTNEKHDIEEKHLGEGHKNMDNFPEGDDMEGMDMGGNVTHGNGQEPIKETPPSFNVLGSFGVINASFIVFGIWNKFFRRRGVSNGAFK